MNTKIIIIVAIIILIIVGIYLFNKSAVPENIKNAQISDVIKSTNQDDKNNINQENIDLKNIPEIKNLSFTFTGYGPNGKFHDGNFKTYKINPESIVFEANSVDTGIPNLDKHLCSADFFDCAKYPEIKFVANKVTKTAETLYQVEGVLFFRDIEKAISFEVKSEDAKNFQSEFILDISEFNFSPTFVEAKVKIKFGFGV